MYKNGEMKLYNYGGLVLNSVLIITTIYRLDFIFYTIRSSSYFDYVRMMK